MFLLCLNFIGKYKQRIGQNNYDFLVKIRHIAGHKTHIHFVLWWISVKVQSNSSANIDSKKLQTKCPYHMQELSWWLSTYLSYLGSKASMREYENKYKLTIAQSSSVVDRIWVIISHLNSSYSADCHIFLVLHYLLI